MISKLVKFFIGSPLEDVKIPVDWKCPYIYKILHINPNEYNDGGFQVHSKLRNQPDAYWTFHKTFCEVGEAEKYVHRQRVRLYDSFRWAQEHPEKVID